MGVGCLNTFGLVNHDLEEPAEDQVGHAVRFLTGKEAAEPVGVVLVPDGVEAVPVDEDVDVNEPHRQRLRRRPSGRAGPRCHPMLIVVLMHQII
jgi:hypothetical protein